MYGGEIAEIYELMHEARGKDYRAEAEEVARRARVLRPDARSLLDVACGTGAHLRFFREIFDRVEGIELSGPMLDIARRRLPGVALHESDMRTFALPAAFDVITCMFGAIGYLEDTAELTAALRRFAQHLRPGGVVVVDPWWFPETYRDGYVSGDVTELDGRTVARLSHSVREGNASRMRVHYLLADAASGVRHVAETHLISLFARRQYEAAFAAAGFGVEYAEGLMSGRGLFVGSLPPDGAEPEIDAAGKLQE